MTIPIETEVLCLCRRCLCSKALSQFRRRRKDDQLRQRICRDCHTAVERERRAFHRSRRDQGVIRNFICEVRAAPTSEHIGMLVALAERRLGGPHQLAREWLKHIHAARQKSGGRKILDFFIAFTRLSVAVSELTPQPNFDAMGDDEQNQTIHDLQMRKMAECLPEFIEKLKRLGWTIEPPLEFEETADESTKASTVI